MFILEDNDTDENNYTDMVLYTYKTENDDNTVNTEENDTDFEEENQSDEDFEEETLYASIKSSQANFNHSENYFYNLNKYNHSYNANLDLYNNENQDSNLTESNKMINNTNIIVKQSNPSFIYSIISLLISLILST